MFEDKKCSIYEVTIVNLDSEDMKSYTPIVSNYPCDFYPKKQNSYYSNNQAKEFTWDMMEVVLNNDIWAKKWQKIELVDSIGTLFGEYIIDAVFPYKNWAGMIDNITLQCKKKDG